MRNACVVALALFGLLLAAPAAGADVRKKFFHANICGSKCELGAIGEPIDGLASKIVAQQPQVVSLNEVCESQVTSLKIALHQRGWPMPHSYYARGHFGENNCQSNDFGVAILSTADLSNRQQWTLPIDPADDPAEAQPKLLCGTVNWARATRVCTTHLSFRNDTTRSRQAQFITQETDYYVDFQPVVLMGDMNASPWAPSMNYFYTRRHGVDINGNYGHGRYKEVDNDWQTSNPPCRCGEFTYKYPSPREKKLDYIFVSDPSTAHWSDMAGNAVEPHSWQDADHMIMHGNALLKTG
jgi:endonuclease/exonuclease/phosphatase family metal-dependent hydrolase